MNGWVGGWVDACACVASAMGSLGVTCVPSPEPSFHQLRLTHGFSWQTPRPVMTPHLEGTLPLCGDSALRNGAAV